MRIYAPVLIGVLDRYEHFRHCVESLSRCTGSQETDLYIALDYPLFETHWEGYLRIEEYLMEINGFKSVNIIKRSENYGVDKNFTASRLEIFEKYDRIIISEDDNEFSPNFLEYINKGLDKFEKDANIYAICGYNYPIKMPYDYKYNFYLKTLFCGWGFASWRHKYWEIPENTTPLLKYINNVKDVIKLEKNGAYLLPGILNMLRTKKIYADVLFNTYLVQQNMYCVFPYISKVRNHGHDGTGQNCGIEINIIYLNQIIDEEATFFYNEMDPFIYDNNEINRKLRKFFRRSFIKRANTFLKYIRFRLMLIRNQI